MGIAFRIQKEALGGQALYPHVLVKNCAVEFNFGQRAEPYCSVLPGFTFIQHLPLSERIRGTVGPKSKAECEVSGPGRPNWRPPLQSHVVAKAEGRRCCQVVRAAQPLGRGSNLEALEPGASSSRRPTAGRERGVWWVWLGLKGEGLR